MDETLFAKPTHSSILFNPSFGDGDTVPIDQQPVKKFNIDPSTGASIREVEKGYQIKKSTLLSSEIDLQDCPDLGPILNVMAMYTKGTTRIYNAQRLRYKESDRIAAMEEELNKCNVDIKTNESEIIIKGKESYICSSSFNAHKDHRIVMSLCVAATLFDKPVIINDAQAINKSYPSFFEDIKNIGVKVELIDD